jgi:serine/threonine protein kinase
MIGKTVFHYDIIEKLGQGGMGVVYLARDTKLKRDVAIKFLPSGITINETDQARFLQEAQAAAAINHPNVCVIHEIQEHGDTPFIVMEYVDGQTLNQKIEHNSFSLYQVFDYALQISSALYAAHQKGIVHRDIKSANIMLTATNQLKVMDFGLAKLQGSVKLTKSSSTVGTMAYSSPEQLDGREIDARADIFSFGVVLYEMATGKVPFQEEYESALMYSIMNDQPESPSNINADIPRELDMVILKALQKQPEDRYQSMQEIINELNDLKSTPGKKDTQVQTRHDWLSLIKRPMVSIAVAIVLLLIAVFAIKEIMQQSDYREVETELIPILKKTIEESEPFNTTAAFRLAQQIEQIQSDHLELITLWPEISSKVTIDTDPQGARISVKEDKDPNSNWQYLGTSPIEGVKLPKAFFRLKVDKQGYKIVQNVIHSAPHRVPGKPVDPIFIKLDPIESIPQKMNRIPETDNIGDFYIDAYEVTNREYKQFIEAGGYRNKSYWKFPVEDGGNNIDWDKAIKGFVDQTGRPGPFTWYAGDYKDGQAEYPVSGICWYEAAAYAEFAGKSLPTDEHWVIASGQRIPALFYRHNSHLVSSSNFSGSGLEPVGNRDVVSAYGLYDVAGNVREWCFNKSDKGRILRGGAWNDAAYLFNSRTQASALDRSPKNGFRCVTYLEPESVDQKLFAPIIVTNTRDYGARKPVADDIFDVYRQLFAYDQIELDPRIEHHGAENKNWIMEKISVNAAYDNDRLIIYFFSPRNKQTPYQTILYFPGAWVTYLPSSNHMTSLPEFKKHFEFLIKSGRAVAFPVYYGTFERDIEIWDRVSVSEHPHQFTQVRIKIIKDVKRSLDYICSRSDVDSGRIGYFGYSWGGAYAPFSLAIDNRIKAAVLKVGG